LSRSSGQVTHVLLTRSRLCPRPKPGSSPHLHVLSTPPAFVLSQDQTLRESTASHPQAGARRLRPTAPHSITKSLSPRIGARTPDTARMTVQYFYSPKRPARRPPEWRGRTWTRSESSPSEDGLESERTCCLVFKDRSPLELVPQKPVAEPKKSLSEERPQSAREMRSLSVDSSSGSYPILQLPLGQRLSVAAN
jgi:hypothetical protein